MKWLELLTVAGATLAAAVTVVVLYSLGVRLTAIAGDAQQTLAGRQKVPCLRLLWPVRPGRALRPVPDHSLLRPLA
jgi:hypothetical protein